MVSFIKYLSIHIDENLKWIVHINYFENFSEPIYITLKSILNYKLKKITHIALFQSIISYEFILTSGIPLNSNFFFNNIKCLIIEPTQRTFA